MRTLLCLVAAVLVATPALAQTQKVDESTAYTFSDLSRDRDQNARELGAARRACKDVPDYATCLQSHVSVVLEPIMRSDLACYPEMMIVVRPSDTPPASDSRLTRASEGSSTVLPTGRELCVFSR